jgi:hypothetical protein
MPQISRVADLSSGVGIHKLAPRPARPDQCPNPDHRAEDRARIRVDGGSGPPFLVDPAPLRSGAIGRADDEFEGQAPCGTRVGAVIVVLLILAWAAGWFGTAARRPQRRCNNGELAG